MKMTEGLDMQGRLTIQTFNQQGQLVNDIAANNAIVYTGRDLVAKLFLNQTIDPIRYLAIGTGNKPIDPSNDKALQTEIFRKELKPLDLARDLTQYQAESNPASVAKSMVRLSADLDFNEPQDQQTNITEAGLFNAKSGGVMYNRVVFPVISKTKDFKLTLVWEIIF